MAGWWWLEPWNFEWLSHHIGNFIIPTDGLIFRGVETTNQIQEAGDFKYLLNSEAKKKLWDSSTPSWSKPRGSSHLESEQYEPVFSVEDSWADPR